MLSPQDYEAHVTSPGRVDFILRTLDVLKSDLADLSIPLHIETCEKRSEVPSRVLGLCNEWKAKHLYANIEYEVDELRREALMVHAALNQGIAFFPKSDLCVVQPTDIQKSGRPHSIYSPWHRAWVAHLQRNPLISFQKPMQNPATVHEHYSSLFGCSVPTAPKARSLSEQERTRFRKLWPAGEHEALDRLSKFLTENIEQYHRRRNCPAENATSMLSVHFAAGTLSGRSAVLATMAICGLSVKDIGEKSGGPAVWIAEIGIVHLFRASICVIGCATAASSLI